MFKKKIAAIVLTLTVAVSMSPALSFAYADTSSQSTAAAARAGSSQDTAAAAQTASSDEHSADEQTKNTAAQKRAMDRLDEDDYDGYIVTFDEGTSSSEIKETVKDEGDDCEKISSLSAQDQKMAVVDADDTVNGDGSDTPAEVVEGYEDQSGVVSVSPNYKRKVLDTDTGALTESASNSAAAKSMSLKDTYFSDLYQFDLMNVDGAWSDLQNNSAPVSKVKVAVIDTGVDLDHEDLSGNLNTDLSTGFVNGEHVTAQDAAQDADTHGTHVTGIIGATANNELGVAGAASGAVNSIVDIMVIRVLAENAESIEDADIILGINYAVSKGAKVINMSLGGYEDDVALNTAINNAYAAGVTTVCAAGNEAEDTIGGVKNPVEYPAASDNTISVAACDSSASRASFSTYNKYVDVMAPGYEIYSTVNSAYYGGSKYGTMSGTSMATPMVTAEAALLYAADSSITPDEVLGYIKDSCSSPTVRTDKEGWGLVNYGKALDMLYEGKAVVNASAGSGGSISPRGSYPVVVGSDQTFTIKANSGYLINTVTVDGVSKAGVMERSSASISFVGITSNHTVSATFYQAPLARGKSFTSGSLKYKVTTAGKFPGISGKVQVTAPKSRKYKSVTIPDSVRYKGYTYNVTSVKSKAFYRATKMRTVRIKSKTLTSIGSKAFKKCKNGCVFKLTHSRYSKYKKMLKKSHLPSGAKFRKI